MNQLLKKRGNSGENLASKYLKGLNHKIIARNYRSRYGEIDIISSSNNCIYFIEVKTRSSDAKGLPHEAVDYRKLDHMKKAAQQFLLKKPYKEYKLKLAVISILLDKNEIKFWDDIEY